MSRDSTVRVLAVAFVLCLVCSVLVSAAAVGLRERQERNKLAEKRKNILLAADLYEPGLPIEEQFGRVEPRIVDLQTGRFAQGLDPAAFDSRSAARDPQTRVEIAPERDLAGIKTRSRYKDVYLVLDGEGRLRQLILPVHGKGLWSTMYGFVSLGDDLTTITGFSFYEHGETPGLGGEIDNPAWKGQWPGKRVFDQAGRLRIEVLKGAVDRASKDAIHQVDGISGATLTARGVSQLLRYWMGEDGYRPFLATLETEGLTP